MTFKKFIIKRKKDLDRENVISIYRNGTINIYAGDNLRGKMTSYAVLYFDEEKLRIGIKLVDDMKMDGTVKIYNFDTQPNKYSLFSCLFLRKYNIYAVGIKKRPFKIHGDMIVLNLKKEDFN